MEFFYKGYRTNVEFDEEEKYFYGKLEGIRDLVNFGTEYEEKIVEEFHSAVDDYLEFCKETNQEPKREENNLKVDPDLYKTLMTAAENAGENLNEFVEKILSDYVSKTA